ncbi:MAG TPA: O-antigen ligase family protein [Chitinophagaceae bacterium]|nr:O-antigen ligase family protein [Chitinophagaceae bacterium]
MILLTGILKNKIEGKSLFHKNIKSFFFASCILFYIIQVSALLYTHNKEAALSDLRIKSGLLFIPLAVYSSGYLDVKRRNNLLFYYSVILAFICLFCLGWAFIKYLNNHDSSLFYYHTLVSPLEQHAVYFSIYVFIGIVYLLESIRKSNFIIAKSYYFILIAFLSVFLFLLASKLVIVYFLFYLAYYFIAYIVRKKKRKFITVAFFFLCIAASAFVFFSSNMISQRFSDLLKGSINIVKQEKYSPGVYFNGIQFRLLEWKLVTETLNKNQRWWAGVSPGDAQSFLDSVYISKNMYAGDPKKGTQGYLVYNTHNQFLESLLQTGIIGLVSFMAIFFFLVRIMWQKRKREASFIIFLVLIFCFSESLLETQYGIILITFFPLFISTD